MALSGLSLTLWVAAPGALVLFAGAAKPLAPLALAETLPKISAGLPKSFRKCSVCFRFFPKISLGNLYLSKLYHRIDRRTGRKFLPAAGAARSRNVNQHLGIGLPSIRKPYGCEGAISRASRGGSGSGQGRSPLRLQEHIENITWSSCQEIVPAHAAQQRRPDVLEQRPPTRSCELVFVDDTVASANLARRHGMLPARTATAGRCPARLLEDDHPRRRSRAFEGLRRRRPTTGFAACGYDTT